jgi:hypothetical protein
MPGFFIEDMEPKRQAVFTRYNKCQFKMDTHAHVEMQTKGHIVRIH